MKSRNEFHSIPARTQAMDHKASGIPAKNPPCGHVAQTTQGYFSIHVSQKREILGSTNVHDSTESRLKDEITKRAHLNGITTKEEIIKRA
jgi:hypothetical protein